MGSRWGVWLFRNLKGGTRIGLTTPINIMNGRNYMSHWGYKTPFITERGPPCSYMDLHFVCQMCLFVFWAWHFITKLLHGADQMVQKRIWDLGFETVDFVPFTSVYQIPEFPSFGFRMFQDQQSFVLMFWLLARTPQSLKQTSSQSFKNQLRIITSPQLSCTIGRVF